MRVSLRQSASTPPRPEAASEDARPFPLLKPAGASVVLGGHQGADGLAVPVRPCATSLFGPRGACLAGRRGPLFVSDTGHHRLMVWLTVPAKDGVPADLVIGQADFAAEGRNGRRETGAATLNVPTGIAAEEGVLAVADAWNHRVLIWHGYPTRSNQPADIVLGQRNFSGCLANRGAPAPRADTLNWCYGVTIAGGRLFVADTGNRRVLIWDRIPQRHGASADLVLGQADFTCRDENAGVGIGPMGMRWPHSVALSGDLLLVADAGNNRVMAWRGLPEANGAPCDFVLGQRSFDEQECNATAYRPTSSTVNMPYSVAAIGGRVAVADTANSRLIGFDTERLRMGAAARFLTGQREFTDKGDNRWGPVHRDSLCWPYGIAACGGRMVVADSGNNRVLLWEAAS